MFRLLTGLLVAVAATHSVAESAKLPVLADMTYKPYEANCRDFMKQIASVHGQANNGVYLESDVLRFVSSMSLVWGNSDAVYLSNSIKTDASRFYEFVSENCNQRVNLDRYWSDFLSMPTLTEDQEYNFNKYHYATCWDIKVLMINFVRLMSVGKQPGIITVYDTMPQEDMASFNESVALKNYLTGFAGGIQLGPFDLISFLSEYCTTREDATNISAALKYASDSPALLGGQKLKGNPPE